MWERVKLMQNTKDLQPSDICFIILLSRVDTWCEMDGSYKLRTNNDSRKCMVVGMLNKFAWGSDGSYLPVHEAAVIYNELLSSCRCSAALWIWLLFGWQMMMMCPDLTLECGSCDVGFLLWWRRHTAWWCMVVVVMMHDAHFLGHSHWFEGS